MPDPDSFPTLEKKRCVGAAEAEGIGQGVLDVNLAHLVRNVVEIAVGIRRLVIDGGRNNSSLNNKRRDSGLYGSRCAEQVADHGLGGTDGKLAGMIAEELLDCVASRSCR